MLRSLSRARMSATTFETSPPAFKLAQVSRGWVGVTGAVVAAGVAGA